MSDALVKALESWPQDGLPDNPEGWLLTVARRRLIDISRKTAKWAETQNALEQLVDEHGMERTDEDGANAFEDERLKLLFVCAHPAINEKIRAPLMLQTVLGLDARRIASAFLIAPGSLGQRLVRAKAKILEAGIRFDVPPAEQLEERLGSVLDTIYAAYTLGWDASYTDDSKSSNLVNEAIWLGQLLRQLMPDEPEVLGLLALMLFCESRRHARRDAQTGQYVPIGQQDPAAWSIDMIDEAEVCLRQAGSINRPGRYQLEAAIQAIHADRRRTGIINWPEIRMIYGGLVSFSPTLGAMLGYATACAECNETAAALEILDSLQIKQKERYQPYWAVRAHVLAQLGQVGEAADCFETAAGLSEDPSVRAYLLERRMGLGDG